MSKMNRHRSFAEMVGSLRRLAAERLFAKAREANAVAKATAGRSRRHAYQIKHRLLERAIQVDPQAFALLNHPAVGRLFVRSRTMEPAWGLHGHRLD